jgi:hypothetical protein
MGWRNAINQEAEEEEDNWGLGFLEVGCHRCRSTKDESDRDAMGSR